MTDEAAEPSGVEGKERPALPRHLAALVGALRGPEDLGANHDAYLAYPSEDSSGGAASA